MLPSIKTRHQNILRSDDPIERSRSNHNIHRKAICGIADLGFNPLESPYLPYFRGDLLDIGCGNGRLAITLLKQETIDSAVMIDISDVSINAAKQGLERDNIQADCMRCAFEEYETKKTFDVIVAGQVLEHVVDCDAVLAKVASLLRPEGVFFGSVPEGNTCDAIVHLHHFELDTFEKLLLKYFRTVEIERTDATGAGEWHLTFVGERK